MKRLIIGSVVGISITIFAYAACAEEIATPTDKNFVKQVSEGDLYEVEASILAEQKAWAPNVKDLAYTEIHDHEQVNRKLKLIAGKDSVPITHKLNSTFASRLAKLSSLPTEQFDTAYLVDMEEVHKIDEKLLAQEAVAGSNNFQEFAHDTDLIVRRHIGAFHALD